jgi:NAD(P)-dependent dehydrogenase (short-subunit alcohol dehydrogenase family)
LNTLFDLSGKVALVTGARTGLGRGMAMALAHAGADIAALGSTDMPETAEAVQQIGRRFQAVKVDLSQKFDATSVIESVVSELGGIDILVNNAALMVDVSYDSIETVSIEAWNKAFAVNTTSALLCARACAPSMRQRGGGRIVNQSSGGAYPATSLYGITKIALVGLTTSLAKQWGKDNITCNAIAPGNVMSDAGKMLVPDDSPFIQFLQMTCATRPRGEPDELVGAAIMLSSPAGAWITGQVIHIDGGWVMRP